MTVQSSVASESSLAVARPDAETVRTNTPLQRYEDSFAQVVSAARAVAFGHARTALASIFRAADLTPGDEVILSPLTCKVVPLTVLSMHLKPVFADISATSLNLEAGRLKAGPRTRAVLFQHTYGSPAGLDSVAAWTRARGLLLIEDCAQCVPLTRAGDAPRRGDAAIFSNNLLKPLPAGSGGMAVTDNADLARRIAAIRDAYPLPSRGADVKLRMTALIHDRVLRPRLYWPFLEAYERFDTSYRSRPIDVEVATEILGVACRPTPYQIGRGERSLHQVELIARQRRLCTSEYARDLSGIPGVDVPAIDSSLPLYYFPALVANKPRLLQTARRRGVELIAWPRTTPIYPITDDSQLAGYGYERGSCPVAESIAARLVGLPTHARITARHRARLLELLRGDAA